MDLIKKFEEKFLKQGLPEIRPGDKVTVWQKIGEDKEGKEKVSPFTGIVIAKKHGKGLSSTITVRGETKRIIVEKIFPLHSPTIKKIDIIAQHKIRRAKLYYLRNRRGKKARLKREK